LAIALVVVAVAGAGFWQSQRAKPGAAQADSSIPGIETLQSVERALVAVVERVKPAVVRIEAEQAPPQQEMRGEEEQGETPDELLRRFFEESPQFRVPRPTPQPSTSLGSGVIIDPAGYVLTARHVVKDADKIWVELDSGEKLRGKVLAMDSETDLAVVKVESSKPLPAAPLGDADTLRAGAYVIAIGSPFNLKHSVSVGYVSATERMIRRMDVEGRAYRHMIQTDAAINRGNSGGPLVDIEGKVVGINNMIFSATGYNVGIGFAVAINGVTKKVIATLEEGKQVQRGLLGVQILDVDKAIASQYGAKEGAFINDVNPGGAADKAGMEDEDIIVQFGDAKVTNVEGLVTAVQATKPGVRVPVKVIRDGKAMTLDVVLGELEAQAESKPAAAKAGGPLGITVQDMTRGLAERYGIQGQSGVVVTEVNPAGDAARTGIRAGDVLTKINRTAIKTVNDYEQAAGKLKPGDPVVLRVLRGDKKNTLTIESLGE
jgi:serine protease Do